MRSRAVVSVVVILVSSATSAANTPPGPEQPAVRPNVVLIMMDDMGYGDLGSYGAPDVRTPHIDRLAREGVRLTNAYANGHVCSPTRAALISGRYPQRFGIEKAIAAPTTADSALGLPVTGTSLPALLKRNGYATGLIGKWHLGFRREFSPQAHGFDDFFGFLAGAHDYYRGTVIDGTTPVPLAGYLTDEITKRAVSFIDSHATGPFFLEVAYNAVHWPFQPPDRPPTEAERSSPRRLVQMPDDSVPATRHDYVKMLERADDGVGKILAALEQHGLTRNTLVIFTNDNGGEWLSRNAPFFHRKGTLWEGGIRVPLIVRWPSALGAGKTSTQVALTMDLTASILAATGTKAPGSYRPDGVNILPVLGGRVPVLERHVFWRIEQPARRQLAIRSGRWKLLMDGGATFLFDLASDPGERQDLARQHPDRVAELIRLYVAWDRDVTAQPATR
ncbi:MAG: atsA 9 [Geminicoccaceae bacterium]|nr:atsA 9 [Geminicoccaceae bacterium]